MEDKIIIPSMSFSDALYNTWLNITNFDGRSRRSELWWSFLVYFIATCIVGLLVSNAIALTAISLVLYAWIAAVTVRRLHDRGHSGWWVAAAIALSVTQNVYAAASGSLELLQAANVTPEEVIEILSSPVYIICSLGGIVCNIVILIFCLQDSFPDKNKYGLSPKYFSHELCKTVHLT